MDGLSGSSSGGSKNNEGGSSSGSKIALPSNKSSTITNTASSSKDSSSSGTNKDVKMKTVEEKDPYMMDLAEDMDETPTTPLYGNKKEHRHL